MTDSARGGRVEHCCGECGSPLSATESCSKFFDRLLALEFENADAFAEHHLTVACYQLQHPEGLSGGAVSACWAVVRASLAQGTPTATIGRMMRARFEGQRWCGGRVVTWRSGGRADGP